MVDSHSESHLPILAVHHPRTGGYEEGQRICVVIKQLISGFEGDLIVLHDASQMEKANPDYAGHFKKLQKDSGQRFVAIYCAIPGNIPRLMARTVSMVSKTPWHIFSALDEAVTELELAGYKIKTDDLNSSQEAVLLGSPKPSLV